MEKPHFMAGIVKKYSKFNNLAVAKIKFSKGNKIRLFNTGQTPRQQ